MDYYAISRIVTRTSKIKLDYHSTLNSKIEQDTILTLTSKTELDSISDTALLFQH